MEWQLIILIVSLLIQALMAVALAAVGIIARRSLDAMDAIAVKVEGLGLKIAGEYYSRRDHDVYSTAVDRSISELRRYARDGMHDHADDLQEHETLLHLLAQHVKYEMPARRPRRAAT